MKNRILKSGLVIMLAAGMLLTGCGGSGGSGDSGSSEEKADSGEAAVQAENMITGVTLEEQVIAEKDGMTVTATGLEAEDAGGVIRYSVTIKVKNDTDKPYAVGIGNMVVNGYQESVMVAAENEQVFLPGETEGRIYIVGNAFQYAPIDKIGEIVLNGIEIREQEKQTVEMEDGETSEYYSTIAEQQNEPFLAVDQVVLQTSEYENVESGVIPEGEALYDEGGIKLVTVDTDAELALGELFYLKNDTDKSIYTSIYDLCINDFMIDDMNMAIQLPRMNASAGNASIGFFGNDPAMLEIMGVEGDLETLECSISIWSNELDEDGYFPTKPIATIEYSYTAE